MRWLEDSRGFTREGHEPFARSCWECNPAHDYLKQVNELHQCFGCNRFWIFGVFLDTFPDDNAVMAFLAEKGMSPGMSTFAIRP